MGYIFKLIIYIFLVFFKKFFDTLDQVLSIFIRTILSNHELNDKFKTNFMLF